MTEFCYAVNLSVIFQIIMCGSTIGTNMGTQKTPSCEQETCFIWFQINYFLTHGPTIFAVFLWQDPIVFHIISRVITYFNELWYNLNFNVYACVYIILNIKFVCYRWQHLQFTFCQLLCCTFNAGNLANITAYSTRVPQWSLHFATLWFFMLHGRYAILCCNWRMLKSTMSWRQHSVTLLLERKWQKITGQWQCIWVRSNK